MAHDHWQADDCPGCDVHSRIRICGSRVAAGYAGEQTLREAVGSIHTTTLRTSPAGITRVNEDHPPPYSFGLVGDVLAQLIERPVTMLASLLATYNRSLADARQIFQGDGSASAYCFFNKLFTDLVVGVLLEACLLPRQFLEHRVEGRRVASFRMYVSAQPSPNRTGNFSLHPALQHSTLSRDPEISGVARTSNTRSTTSVCVAALDGYVSGPSPVVHGFPVLPGWALLHRLLRPVCPTCPVASQARLPFTGRDRWFLGSCLVTG